MIHVQGTENEHGWLLILLDNQSAIKLINIKLLILN